MLRVFTGENRLLSGALLKEIGTALAGEDAVQYIVVPKQLTLFTERLLLDGLKLRGSFRLRVLSPARLCTQIFEAAGAPEGVRVDERGRVMLVRRAIRAADGLTIYKNALRRRGFAGRCARQLELFLQGGVGPEELRACARECVGAARMKLNDLAILLESYAELARGRYQDGESELTEAAERARRAAFVREGHFWFFGFDITPPTLTRLMAEIAAACPAAELFLPLPNDERARDYDCNRPLERALSRLSLACRDAGAPLRRVPLPAQAEAGELRALERELYAYPVRPWTAAPERVRLTMAKDARQECMLAAATCRRLAMEGMRYGEMQLICADVEANRQGLIEAFRLYGVPLVLESSRPVSRMATAECLLTALRLIDKNFRSEDVFTLMRCGFMDLSGDEADRLANYAVRRGLEGARWLRPLSRGTEAEIAELEPLRARLMAPVLALREALRGAKDLKGQLAALFHFLEEIDACGRSAALQRALNEQGLWEEAGALSQAWNRIMGALDQMAALMGGERLSLRELDQALSESLEAAVIKPLPQSGDAVYAQGMGRILMQPARALIVMGLADGGAGEEDGLLTSAQRKMVAERTRAYLGPDETDAARMKRFYLKSALGMVSQRVFFSCALSGADGAAQRPGLALELLREIFPGLREITDSEVEALLCCAPGAALGCAARAISARRAGEKGAPGDLAAEAALIGAGERLSEAAGRLRRMEEMLRDEAGREAVNPASARALYGRLQSQSITRLERYANCPFSYFIAYGLRPDRVEPFAFDRRQAGSFLHEAAHEFLRACGRELNELSPEAAEARMGRIADSLLAKLRVGTPMEDSAGARAEARGLRATACRCARVLAAHMRGSAFHTEQLERSFGREDGARRLQAGDTVLEGRIDRMDFWSEGNSLRVIDFKLGGKPLNLAGAYYGLQLQLPVYLGAALKQRGARSAGVYYFPLDEGVVNTQSTDPGQVEKERASRFRMSGLLPEDPELLLAQTPNPAEVFQARVTGEGKLYANTPCADDVNFERLVIHALRKAREQVEGIRAGEARVSPASFDGREACALCDSRAACLFDSRLDAGRVRRLKNIKWNEVFEKIALEDGEEMDDGDRRKGSS